MKIITITKFEKPELNEEQYVKEYKDLTID